MVYGMTLSDKQFQFLKDSTSLMQYIINKGWKLTYGETWRREETQKRLYELELTTTLNSKHIKKLAIDLNIFVPQYSINPAIHTVEKSGQWFLLLNNKDNLPLVEDIGAYWENLHEGNKAGMFWKSFVDMFHFEAKE